MKWKENYFSVINGGLSVLTTLDICSAGDVGTFPIDPPLMTLHGEYLAIFSIEIQFFFASGNYPGCPFGGSTQVTNSMQSWRR